MFTFKRQYFILTVLILAIEIFIALYVHDRIVRPYIGDYLVVILLYCFFRTFVNASVFKTAVAVLLIAYLVEFSQYLNLINWLGLQESTLAKLILGNHFEWIDMLAYTLGCATILLLGRLKPSAQSA